MKQRTTTILRRSSQLMFLFCCLFLSITAQAQTSVNGSVSDELGKPLEGATVANTNNGKRVLTNEKGAFTIEVGSADDMLEISFVGKQTRMLKAGSGASLNVQLQINPNDLNDVVVIGYGTQRKKDLTGSVYSIKNADLVRTPTFNPVEAMQGRVPGVDITRTSGVAGSGVNIRVRGNRTINGSNDPLFIIDGFQGGNPSSINPNDIESIEVLKDASATAIYGAQGANGVFIITTKKGVSGKPKVEYDGYYGQNGYTQYPKGRFGQDYINLRREAYRTVGEWSSPADDQNLFTADEWDAIQRDEWEDWFDLTARNGQQQSHTVSLRGGGEKTRVFLSASYFKEEGMLRNNSFERYTVRTNVDQTITKWAKAGVNMQLTVADNNRRFDPMGLVNQTSPIAKAFDDNGNVNVFPVYGENSILSPLADDRGDTVYKNNEYLMGVLANGYIEIKPFKDLTFRSTFGTNLNFSRGGIFQGPTSVAQRLTRQTIAQQITSYGINLNFDNVLTYSKTFGEHALTVTGIQSYIQSTTEGLNVQGFNQLLSSQLYYNMAATAPASRVLSSSYVESNNLAFAGRVNYAFKGRYLLSLTYRADGASRLSAGKWDYFPSISAGWNITDENFMRNVGWINALKLRASYGTTGNYGIAVYGTQSTLNSFSNLGFGEHQASYFYYNQYIGNPELKWEKSATTNIGIDFGLFKNRINGNIDLYNTTTTGLLYLRTLPRSSGSVNNGTLFAIYENIGETNNKGIEIALNAGVIQQKNFNWSTTLTFTKNKEKLVKLITDQNIIDGANPENNSLLIGRPINSFFSYKKLGIWQTNEADKAGEVRFGTSPFKPGDLKIQDLNGDSVINESDRQYLGSTVPKFVLGWQNNFTYKNFDLGIYIFTRWGQTIAATYLTRFNPGGTGNGPAEFDYWTPENPTNDFPRPRKGGQWINYYAYQGFHYVDGSFIKIKTVTLGYSLGKKAVNKIKADHLRLYVTANNFFTYANSHLLRNYDPERGGDEGAPLNRQWVVGLNVGF
jgi:TonB-linked SusC/RagA family outer membrane protein